MLKRYLAGCLLAGILRGFLAVPPLAGVQGLALDPDRGVESFRSVLWGWEIESRHNKQLRLQQKIMAVCRRHGNFSLKNL